MADTERFQLEGNAPQLYERTTVVTLGRPMAELMFEHVSLHEGERILDAACGTGIVARVAVERYTNIGSIVGIDLNPAMLDVARANTPTTDIPIEWCQGDVCALPLPDGCFDVVLCQQGLQFVSDTLTALREMRRVLVPGGRLVFTVWSEVNAYDAALADALTRHVNAEAATSCLSPFTLRDAETIRKLMDDVGFHGIEMQEIVVMRRMPSSVEAIVQSLARTPYAHDVAAVSEEARQAIGQEVSTALQAYRDGDDFIILHQTHLVQARID